MKLIWEDNRIMTREYLKTRIITLSILAIVLIGYFIYHEKKSDKITEKYISKGGYEIDDFSAEVDRGKYSLTYITPGLESFNFYFMIADKTTDEHMMLFMNGKNGTCTKIYMFIKDDTEKVQRINFTGDSKLVSKEFADFVEFNKDKINAYIEMANEEWDLGLEKIKLE
ncbi:MAG: hypothetical protein E7254_03430 [Lachnospiraceae bacterium]|nr:hypothetical protein [Lachnospiraceae bacterium]